jgi:two-component system, NarL family, nitrate/nitrite response regulator NarL
MAIVTVALVGGGALHRDGLRRSLDSSHFEVIAEGRDFESVLALANHGASPRLIVADVSRLSEKDVEDLRRVRDAMSDCRIVILSNDLSLIDLRRVFRAGADGYLLTELSREAFSFALLLVVSGEKVLPGALADVIASNCQNFMPSKLPISQAELTDRERQILRCLLNGDSNKAIARVLKITEGTVKVHLKTLMKKISAANRTQAALWARGEGMCEDSTPHIGSRLLGSGPSLISAQVVRSHTNGTSAGRVLSAGRAVNQTSIADDTPLA